MGVLERTQQAPAGLEDAFAFFGDPQNLADYRRARVAELFGA